VIENVRCFDDTPHYPHEMTITLIYPCSGANECGQGENHKLHEITKVLDARCPGVLSNLN
jgi:hypothetical protein